MRYMSPLPFGVLSPGHWHKNSFNHRIATSVTIAFRRSVPRPPFLAGMLRLACLNGSPLPFGVLSPGHARRSNWTALRNSCHHCLSAFCPPATAESALDKAAKSIGSPLPFGVLSPGHALDKAAKSIGFICHHCLSAFCPPATREVGRRKSR